MSTNLDIYHNHLFSDEVALKKANVPAPLQERIIRVRDVYNRWLSFPNKKDAEIICILTDQYSIRKSQAYEDLRLIKQLLGDLNQASTNYHRWKFNEMIMRAYEKAESEGDPKAMVAAMDKYAKYNKLDRDEADATPWEELMPQPFVPTSDPSVLGIKPVKDIVKKIAQMEAKYADDLIEDIEYEEVDFREDELFQLNVAP